MEKIKTTFIFLASICGIFSAKAQYFKWVTGGGAASPPAVQNVAFMCTDPNGNVYALSIIAGNAPITADTFHSSFYYGVNNIILITSYNCNGQMRWAKPIGSNSGVCKPFGIAADSLGHIYMAGSFSNQTLFIGSDTTIPSYYYFGTGLIQFDTSGHFDWIRYIGVNTFSSLVATSSVSNALTVDGGNSAHYFCYVQTGVPLMSGDTSIYGVYDIKYNTSGTMLSAVRLDLDSEWYLTGAVIDPVTNKLYVYGQDNMSMGLGVDTSFAAAFDASRNQLWWHFCGHGGDDAITGIVLDPTKHLYFSGESQPFTDTTRFVFNNDSVSAPGFFDIAVIMKTDSDGHVNWIKHFDSHEAVNYFAGVTLLPNNIVAVTGTFSGKVVYGSTDSLIAPATTEGQDPYVVLVDSAGDLETMQVIHEDGVFDGYNGANAIVSDRVGNMYIGGAVVDSIWAGTPPIPAFHSIGGQSNFFVMKYGVDCSCTSMPVASYSDTGTHTIGFTYSGTTTGIDSVVWNFDDGHTGTGTTALHTYSVSGTYRVCVTVYTSCGEDLYCSNVTVHIPSEIATLIASNGISVYPNPVGDVLNVTGLVENTAYRLLNITGVCLLQGTLQKGSNTVGINNFVPGQYILELTGKSGVREMVRVVKE